MKALFPYTEQYFPAIPHSEKKKGYSCRLLGLTAGLLNGLLGSGGGIAAVPLLEQMNIPPQKAHATSVAVILPLSAASAVGYLLQGVSVDVRQLIWLIPWGIAGAWTGAILLRKVPNSLLRRIFGAIILYSGVRMLL